MGVRIGAEPTAGAVELSIEDNGVGVPDDEYEQLCDKFYRGRRRHPDARGTGIGLSIAKGFIEAMGGSIQLGPSRRGPQGLRVAIGLGQSGGAQE